MWHNLSNLFLESSRAAQAGAPPETQLAFAVLDAVPAHIAVVTREGEILAVNRGWVDFARANGDSALLHTGVGCNYFDVCRAPASDERQASAALAGMLAVLRGETELFELEYPCHSPTEERWFMLRVTPLMLQGERALLISHTNITERRRRARADVQNEERQREMRSVEALAQPTQAGAVPRFTPSQPLRQIAPQVFETFVQRYGALLDQALEQRVYQGVPNLSEATRAFAEQLGALHAGPRDLIDIHLTGLKRKSSAATHMRIHAYLEEGRLLVLELMGHLVSFYRAYSSPGTAPGDSQIA